MPIYLAVVLLGLVNGCRTMTPIAVLCWSAWAGSLHMDGTWGFWTAKLVSAIVFSVLALGEYVGDKLPSTPNRTAALPLAARLLFGGVVGALVATAGHGSPVAAGLVGAAAACAGAFAGFHARRWLTRTRGLPDLPVALVEDALVIAVSVVALRMVSGLAG